MAEALSASASVLAVVSACTACASQLYGLIQTLRHAPEETLSILNQIKDTKVVLEALHAAIQDEGTVVDISFEQIIARTKSSLAKLQSLMNQTATKLTDGTHRVNWPTWLLRKGKLLALYKELKNVRLSLHMLIQTAKAYVHSALLQLYS
jgi:hypothetical protein